MDLNTLLNYVKEHNASDLILSPNLPPIVRIHGDMHKLHMRELTKEEVTNIILALMTERQKIKFEDEMDIDFSVESNKQRFRANAFVTSSGPTIAMRSISDRIRSLQELMVPNIIEKFTKLKRGLIIITGPTGSGKSTTLASMIDHINKEFNKHIITIEDPIEYKFTSNKCIINQREIGTHSLSFSRALKGALRENPDIIMIGELRDLESIQLALTAAETGHLVFCTLHTSSAAKTIDRIIDVFPTGDKPMIRTMLATSLEGIISQTLLINQNQNDRVAAYEVLIANPAIRNLIRENKLHQISTMMQIGVKQGMILMEQSIKSLYEKSIISEEIAREYLTQLQEKEEKKPENGEANKSTATFEDNEF